MYTPIHYHRLLQAARPLIALPHHHKGPFDRLLVAQAIVEGIPLVSADLGLDRYPITRLW